MSMKIYSITREGVYRHEILGLYCDSQEAEKRAYVAIAAERDDYHQVCVMVCETDKPIEDGIEILRLSREKTTVITHSISQI